MEGGRERGSIVFTKYSIHLIDIYTHTFTALNLARNRQKPYHSAEVLLQLDFKSAQGLNKNNNEQKQQPFLIKQAPIFSLTKNYYLLWKRVCVLGAFFHLKKFPLYLLIHSLLHKESFVHLQENKLKYEGNLSGFLCSFLCFSV